MKGWREKVIKRSVDCELIHTQSVILSTSVSLSPRVGPAVVCGAGGRLSWGQIVGSRPVLPRLQNESCQ